MVFIIILIILLVLCFIFINGACESDSMDKRDKDYEAWQEYIKRRKHGK